MISEEKIVKLINELVTEKDLFIVKLEVNTSNTIKLLVDSHKGIQINECVALSRSIENGLDREKEDFELTVSSPGLDSPFTVLQQYQKNIGREVKVKLHDGKKLQGILIQADDKGFSIEEKKKIKIEGKKKKQSTTERNRLVYDNVDEVKVIIKF